VSFALPLGLLGLLSLPVILALHLFRKRQRRLAVSSLELWAFLKPEVHGARPRRIPLTWLLLIDLLIAILASLALAQPRLNLSLPAHKARHMLLLVDLSTSMRASDAPPSRLGQAQTEMKRLLAGLGAGDTATLITFGVGVQIVSDTRQESVQALAVRAAALQAGETGHNLGEALALGLAALDGKLPAEFHILTDGAFPDPQVALRTPNLGVAAFSQPITWHIFGETGSGNQAVLGISAAETADGKIQVFARLANFSEKPVTRVVSLLTDDHLVTSTTVHMAAGETIPQVWLLNRGPAAATVLLSGGDTLSEDDAATIGLSSTGKARVTLVSTAPYPLKQALAAAASAETPEIVLPADYSPAGQVDLTVFRGALPVAWPDGTVLLVEPTQAPENSPALAWVTQEKFPIPANALLEVKNGEPLLAGLDFGGVRWGEAWKLAALPSGFEVLLAASDAQGQSVPLLVRGWSGGTRILALLVDLKAGNFSKHPAFPLLINNLVESVRRAPLAVTIRTGQLLILPPAGEYRSVRIIPPEASYSSGNSEASIAGKSEAFSGTWPAVWAQTLEPGGYRLELEDMAGRQLVQVVGVNAGDETESDLSPRTWVSAQASRAAAGSAVHPGGISTGVQEPLNLAPWLAGLAGLLLLLEAGLAWR
jgi:Ca-activated chloride channel family protein